MFENIFQYQKNHFSISIIACHLPKYIDKEKLAHMSDIQIFIYLLSEIHFLIIKLDFSKMETIFGISKNALIFQ